MCIENRCVIIGYSLLVLSFTIPLLLILISTILVDWFDVYRNALSDLGHSTKSSVAWIYNLGLSTGGVLIVVLASIYVVKYKTTLGVLTGFTGYTLILIGVFDEVYGFLHGVVSVLFFTLLLLLILVYAFTSRNKTLMVIGFAVFMVNLSTWILHFVYKTPRGAAIPELIAVFTALPLYVDMTRRSIRSMCKVVGS